MSKWLTRFKQTLPDKLHYVKQDKDFFCFGKPQLVVVDNNDLEKRWLDYHTVLLDATEDYLLNQYPKNKSAKDIYQVPAMQCIVFVNEDGSYWTAQPSNYYYRNIFRNRYLDNYAIRLPQLRVDLKTIQKVLAPIDLSKDNGYYNSVLTNTAYKRNNGLQFLAINYKHPLYEIYNELLENYLYNNFQVSFMPDGKLKVKLTQMNDFWEKRLATVDSISYKGDKVSLTSLMQQLNPKSDVMYDNSLLKSQNWEKLISIPLAYKTYQALSAINITVQGVKAIDLTNTKQNTVKSLMPSKNLNKLISLITDIHVSDHHDYYYQNEILSLASKGKDLFIGHYFLPQHK